MTTDKRYTNLADFNQQVMKIAETDTEEFEIIEESQIFNQSKYSNEDFEYLTEEDQKIKANIFNLTSVFNKCLPKIKVEEKQESFKDLQESLTHSDTKMFCKRHPKIQISYVCINDRCPFSFFCNRCLKTHSESCDKVNMYLNPQAICSEEYCSELFNEEEFDEENELKKVKSLIEEKRKKINKQLDGLLKLSEDKLKSQSKEYKLLYFSEHVKTKLEKFKSEKSYMNLLDLAHESFKLDMIYNMETLPIIDDQIKNLNDSLNNIEKDVDKSVENFKKTFNDSLLKDKKVYISYWQDMVNVKCHNQKLKQPFNNNYKIESQINLPKMTKKNNEPKEFTEIDNETNSELLNNEVEDILKNPDFNLNLNKAKNNITPHKNVNNSSMMFEGTVIIQAVKHALQKYTTQFFSTDEIDYIAQTVIPDEFKTLGLKYRISSTNGFKKDKFYHKVNDVNPSIMLCVTKDGRKFGGVNYLPWGKQHDDKLTDKNFIFSIDEKTKHELKPQVTGQHKGTKMTNDAIEFDEDCGPMFGDGDLVIGDDCTIKESCTSNLGNTYTFNFVDRDSNTYLAKKAKFSLKALYIFQMRS